MEKSLEFFDKLPAILQAAAIAGAFVLGGIIAAILRLRNNNNNNAKHKPDYVTKVELLQAAIDATEQRSQERQGIYDKLAAIQLELKLDIAQQENHLAEFAKSVDARLRAIETSLAKLAGAAEARSHRGRGGAE